MAVKQWFYQSWHSSALFSRTQRPDFFPCDRGGGGGRINTIGFWGRSIGQGDSGRNVNTGDGRFGSVFRQHAPPRSDSILGGRRRLRPILGIGNDCLLWLQKERGGREEGRAPPRLFFPSLNVCVWEKGIAWVGEERAFWVLWKQLAFVCGKPKCAPASN